MKKTGFDRLGQIWVETVIYTLIALVLLGVMLAFAVPQIQKQKDKAIISNTISAMSELDNNIIDVRRNGIANVREMSFLISQGSLTIDSPNDLIIFEVPDSSYLYSELGRDVALSGTNLKALSEKNGKKYKVTLTLDYRSGTKTNITYNNNDDVQVLSPSSVNYNLLIENRGRNVTDPTSLTRIDISQ